MTDSARRAWLASLVTVAAASLSSCSSSDFQAAPADIHGNWAGTVHNQSNSCPGSFTVGDTSNVAATIAQDGTTISITLSGGTGFLLSLGFGSSTFSGTLTGAALDAKLLGSKTASEMGCNHTWNAHLVGTLSGAGITGTVT